MVMSKPAVRARRHGAARRGAPVALALAAACALSAKSISFVSSLAGARFQVVPRSSAVIRHARGGEESFQIGDRVRAISPDDERWYPAKVSSIQEDGSLEVAWEEPDEGFEKQVVDAKAVKMVFKNYKKGDDVKAVSPDDDKWYPGNVEAENKDGTFKVKWDDPDGGDETNDVEVWSMRKVMVKRNYKEGDAVEAIDSSDGRFYPATVSKINKDGTFQVKWDDPDGGDEFSDCSPKDMKVPPIPLESLKSGDKYTGTVMGVRDFGAFVDIGAEAQGLLHISQISATERVENINDHLEEGQEVEVFVTSVRDDGKFGLSMIEGGNGRAPRANSDVSAFTDVPSDQWLDGEIISIAKFGIFVRVKNEAGAEAEGLVHITKIRDGFIEDIFSEGYSRGQAVKCRVSEVNVDNGKMSLTFKDSDDAPRREREPADYSSFRDISEETWLDAKVTGITNYGAWISVTSPTDAEVQVPAMVHVSRIANHHVDDVNDEMSVDQEVKVRCTGFDDQDRMVVDMRPIPEEGEEGGEGDGDFEEEE